jgi:hypothetical protein
MHQDFEFSLIDGDRPLREATVAPAAGGTAMSETAERVAEGYVSQEFLDERAGYWVTIGDRRVFVGCGDDRPPTAESAEALMIDTPENTMSPAEGYMSVYGGAAGEAKTIIVVGAAQYGAEFIHKIGGFDGAMDLVAKGKKNLATLHSAEDNEGDPAIFCIHGGPVGCAYCMGVGATSALIVGEDPTFRNVGRDNQKYVFASDNGFDDLLRGNQLFLTHATGGKGGDFVVDRDAYNKYMSNGLRAMILQGTHIGAKDSGVISNFDRNRVGSATAAHRDGRDFYRLDIAPAAEAILEIMKDSGYKLSAELLMRQLQLDSTPVRGVLVSHDKDETLRGTSDPTKLPMGFVGNPWEAIKQLDQAYPA